MKRSKVKTIKDMFTKLFIISAVLLSGLICYSTQIIAAESTVEKVDHFTNDGFGDALEGSVSPSGIYDNGITYVSYQGPLEDPYVAAYNHETKEWQGPFKAGVSELGKVPSNSKIDNHGRPTMLIDDLGYIHIFFGGHGGSVRHGVNKFGDTHNGSNKHVVSKKPYDISEWEELDTIPPFGNYNQAVKMDNGDIYLFYRHGAHESDWVYQKSTDNGRTFEDPISFLETNEHINFENKGKGWDSWYAYARKGEDDNIIITYDYHICWDVLSNGDRGHTTERHNVYYMEFNTKEGTWKNVEGKEVNIPVTYEVANNDTLVANTGDEWTFNGTVHLDSDGNPHIGVNIGTDLGVLKTGGPKQTSYFHWTGKEWVGGNPINPQARIDGIPTYGDFFVDSPTDVTFILGYQEVNDDGVVAYFNSKDGGKTFTKEKELLRRKNESWMLSSIIENSHPEARIIVAEKRGGTIVNGKRHLNFGNVYLLGDEGPIQRNKDEIEPVEVGDPFKNPAIYN